MQNFINDLIRTVEQGEESEFAIFCGVRLRLGFNRLCPPVTQESPSKTVELFINLVGRHEQNFYNFVHKVQTKGEGLFDSLMRWIELFLSFVREGIARDGEKISLEFILPHAGESRVQILKEVDQVALYHYKMKVAYEAKVRRRFMRQSGAAAEEEVATQALVDNVLGELQFGSLLKGDTEDIYAEEDEESDEDSSSEFESTDDDGISEGSSVTSQSHPPSKTNARTLPVSPLHSGSPSPSIAGRPPPAKPSPDREVPPTPPKIITTGPPTPSSRSSIPSTAPSATTPTNRNSLEKPLPLPPSSPGSSIHSGRGHRRTGSRASDKSTTSRPVSSVAPAPRKKRKPKKDGAVELEAPELTAIPELLPIFVELVSYNSLGSSTHILKKDLTRSLFE